MSKLESKFEPGKTVFQTEMPPLTISKLKVYCDLFETPINKYYLKSPKQNNKKNHRAFLNGNTRKYSVPGTFILDMFRKTISKLHKESPTFPISMLNHMEFAVNSTEENPIFVNDKLTFKVQNWKPIKVESRIKIAYCKVEIYRGNYIVFKGTFEFMEKI